MKNGGLELAPSRPGQPTRLGRGHRAEFERER